MAHLHEVLDTDSHFIINSTTMAIEIESDVKPLKQGDHRSERYSFEMPRYIEGHDMSLCNKVEVHYNNINYDKTTKELTVNKSFCEVKDFRVSETDEDTVVWSWLVDGDATQLVGNLNFCIRFACVEGDKIEYQKFTETFVSIPVGETIWNTEAMATEYADVLEQWRQEILDAIGNGDGYEDLAVSVDEISQMATANKNAIVRNGDRIIEIADQMSNLPYIRTVNGTYPDENGNVEITIPDSSQNVDLTGYATEEWVQDKIAEAQLSGGNADLEQRVSTLEQKVIDLEAIIKALQDSMGSVVTYGKLILSETAVTVGDTLSARFTVKLDKAPTEEQTVTLTSDNDILMVSPASISFTSENYGTEQEIAVSIAEASAEAITANVTVSTENDTAVVSVNVTASETVIEWYTVQLSDITSSNTANGVYNANAITTDQTNLYFTNLLDEASGKYVLWKGFPATVQNAKYSDDTNASEIKNNGTSGTPSALKRILNVPKSTTSLKLNYAPELKIVSDLSECSELKTLEITYCDSIENYPAVPDSTTSISFYYNPMVTDLSNWKIPQGVTTLRNVFRNNTALVKAPIIDCPNVTNYNLTFTNCPNLREVRIENVHADYITTASTGFISSIEGACYPMLYCAPTNAAFPVLREYVASSSPTYNKATFGLDYDGDEIVNRICMYGDSLTRYGGDTGTYGTMPLQLLGMMADNVVVQNFGYPGQSSKTYKTYFDERSHLQADVSVVWFGTNNVTETGDVIASGIQSNIIDGLTSDKYIVVGLLQQNYTDEKNTAYANKFGEHFLDIHAYILANWESITGLTPTDDDVAAVAEGNIPPSLLQSDSCHLNEYSGQIVAQAIKEKLLTLGYIDSTWLAE